MKKICMLLLSALLLLPLCVVSADSPSPVSASYNSTANTVTVDGVVAARKNAAVVVMITQADNPAAVGETTPNTIVSIVRSGADGRVTHTEKMPASFAGGRYEVFMQSQTGTGAGYFIYPVKTDIAVVLPYINGATTAAEMERRVWEKRDPLAIDEIVFLPVKTPVSQVLYALKPATGYASADAFLYAYNNALAAVALQNSEVVSDVLRTYGTAINVDTAIYDGLTEDELPLFEGYMYAENYLLRLVEDAFSDNITRARLKAAKSWNALKTQLIAADNDTQLSPDKTYFSQLASVDTFYQQLFAGIENVDTMDGIRTLYYNTSYACYEAEQAAEEEDDDDDRGFGGGGGSVGGSIGGFTPVKEKEEPKEDPKDEPPLTAPAFSDVEKHWSRDYVEVLSEAGIISGFPDGTFKPEASVTRAETIKMIVMLAGANVDAGAEDGFGDVNADDWFAPYVSAGVANGYIFGNADGNFNPTENITREDVCVILYRALQLDGDASAVTFKDREVISSYAKEAVEKLVAAGIVQGDDTGAFNPRKAISRGEIATLLSRAMQIGKE